MGNDDSLNTEKVEIEISSPDRRTDWVEILCAILLALTTIATAWSGYQATRWHSDMAVKFTEANSARIKSTKSFGRATEEIAYDAELVADYEKAQAEGNTVLAEYIENHMFAPELKDAMEAWRALDPENNPDAPRSPLEMPQYENKYMVESEELDQVADTKINAAENAVDRGDNYVLLTVIFASVLFFAGISSKFKGKHVRIALTFFGYLIFIFALIIVIQMPVH